jgi:hypothetical protein
MRSIARMGLIAAVAALAGCQAFQYGPDRFSATVYDEVPPHPVRFPTKLVYPDNTMFGFAIYDDDPRSDLRLDSISCRHGDDTPLIRLATVPSMGADDIYRVPFYSGDMAAFRVAATVTTRAGAQGASSGALPPAQRRQRCGARCTNSTSTPAAEVTRIDVVADPDRVVPDPIRDNNVLSSAGAIDAANPQCTCGADGLSASILRRAPTAAHVSPCIDPAPAVQACAGQFTL